MFIPHDPPSFPMTPWELGLDASRSRCRLLARLPKEPLTPRCKVFSMFYRKIVPPLQYNNWPFELDQRSSPRLDKIPWSRRPSLTGGSSYLDVKFSPLSAVILVRVVFPLLRCEYRSLRMPSKQQHSEPVNERVVQSVQSYCTVFPPTACRD